MAELLLSGALAGAMTLTVCKLRNTLRRTLGSGAPLFCRVNYLQTKGRREDGALLPFPSL